MAIIKPFTFRAGEKARAAEVNQDFDILYQEVNNQSSEIQSLDDDITSLENSKANINGNSSQRFAVADAVGNYDAINKQTLVKNIANMVDYINGLSIEKDSQSPNDTILVNPGSCYDSTSSIILKLQNITSKKNEGQGANATYYVYITGNNTGGNIDIAISQSSTGLVGYDAYRCIGSFTTDSSGNIYEIKSNSGSQLFNVKYMLPDWDRLYSVNPHNPMPDDGWLSVSMVNNYGGDPTASINGHRLLWFEASQYGGIGGGVRWIIPVKKGDVLSGQIYASGYFIPFKGGN